MPKYGLFRRLQPGGRYFQHGILRLQEAMLFSFDHISNASSYRRKAFSRAEMKAFWAVVLICAFAAYRLPIKAKIPAKSALKTAPTKEIIVVKVSSIIILCSFQERSIA